MERMKKSFVCFLFVIFSFLCNGCELRAYHADENEHHDKNPLTVMKWNVSAPNWTHASLVGNELFIAVNADQTNRASVNELLAVNVKTKKQRMLFQSAHEEAMVQWVQANNRWVVWEDSTSFGAESTIWVMDRKTGSTFLAARSNSSPPTVFNPVLDGEYIAWTEKGSQFGQVKLFHLPTKQGKTIGRLVSQGLYNEFVSLRNGKVIWTDSHDGKGYYYVYDIRTGRSASYESPAPFPAYAEYDNGLIYAIHLEDLEYPDQQTFGYFDLKTKRFSRFPVSHGIIQYFDVSNGKLAFLDDRGAVSVYEQRNGKWKAVKVSLDRYPRLLYFDQQDHLIVDQEDTKQDRRWLNIVKWP
ncbi:hypothetical protein [Geobacillus sp. B4113_201601]|uniref:TolB family protein n=1 Tax=Geobacillus sp. B4113_201601 TaxID=1586290 RepID=UPI0007982136|nr:hypothetical protein [Geobacillus sp. B4113_201601]KYD29182.1 hypothetical protein B4113_2336 [Geobacillus sp. B4113_201601]